MYYKLFHLFSYLLNHFICCCNNNCKEINTLYC